MTSLSPKRNFQQFHKPLAELLQQERERPWLTVGFVYALAEMADRGASEQQMLGARNLIHIFQNLWEPADKTKSLPIKRLETYDISAEDIAELAKKRANEEKAKEAKR